jgi:UDP-glucuronate decarboxylase
MRYAGLTQLMDTPNDFTGPVNIGNSVEFTILQLAEKVISFTGSSSKLIKLPLPEDDPKQRQPDISMARKHLSWEPAVALDEGLGATIAYFREWIA